MRLFLCALLLTACVAPQPHLKPVEGDDVTVFVHGYKGSFLDTATGERAWITVGAAVSQGDRSLALPFEGQREGARFGPLQPAGPVTKLTAIPFLFEEDAYATWMDWAKDALPGFIVWSYDWRLDLRETGAGLCAFLERLGPQRRIRVVAHSMGGLVTLQCLTHASDSLRAAVKKVAFLGTPFRGGPGQWDDLLLGTKTSANSKLLDAEALITMPAAWQLLPPEPDFFFDDRGARADLPAYDGASWVEGHWGLFSDPALPPAYRRQLEQRLEAHRAFWASIAEAPAPAPEVMAVIGRGRATVSGWVVRPGGGFDFAHPLTADGDGSVLAASAKPPFKATVVETTGEHNGMLRLAEVQAVLADFLR